MDYKKDFENEYNEFLKKTKNDPILAAKRKKTDALGKAVIKGLLEKGFTEEEIDKIFFRSLVETLEKRAGSGAVKDLKQYKSLKDMIDKGAV